MRLAPVVSSFQLVDWSTIRRLEITHSYRPTPTKGKIGSRLIPTRRTSSHAMTFALSWRPRCYVRSMKTLRLRAIHPAAQGIAYPIEFQDAPAGFKWHVGAELYRKNRNGQLAIITG